MIEKIHDNFTAGLQRLRWFSGLLSERIKMELAVFRLAAELKEIEKKSSEVARSLGMRVFEVHTQEGIDLLSDQKVKEAIKEIERLQALAEDLRQKITEISRAGL